MEEDYKAFQAAGAEVIAISSDKQKEAKRAATWSEASFPVLSDPELQAVAAYNVVDNINPKDARPVTYVIDEAGIIRWKFLDVRVGLRIDNAQIIAELKKI